MDRHWDCSCPLLRYQVGVERAAPTDAPADVLERVLDKGIVTRVSLRLGDAPITLAGSGDRIVAESEVYLGEVTRRTPRAA
jgi:hypothetical protein